MHGQLKFLPLAFTAFSRSYDGDEKTTAYQWLELRRHGPHSTAEYRGERDGALTINTASY